MRIDARRALALTAAAGLFLAACGEDDAADQAQDGQATDEAPEQGGEDGDPELDEQDIEDLMGNAEDMEDPTEDVEDGVYRGNGVVLPVPEGWSLDPAALQQGIVAAVSEDGLQQMTAQAIDATAAEAAGGEPLELDSLVESVREQIDGDPETDEEVELTGAERAHRFTVLDLPSPQEGQPGGSTTILIAEDGGDLVGEFVYSAGADDYDGAFADELVDEAGFDPDSEVPQAPAGPQPQPAPQGEGG